MSHTPVGGHPQGWEHKLADRSSLPPAPGEERSKSQSRYVFTHPLPPKGMSCREETEGSSASSGSPPYLRWARTLHDLLDDTEGVRLFRAFVGEAGGLHVDRLNFYFAVQGLRQESEPAKIRQFVFAIYRFLRKSQLAMPEELKQFVRGRLKAGADLDRTVFDQMEQEVTRSITETTYQAFLRSEAYVSYVSAATQPLASPDDPPAKEPLTMSASPLCAGGAGGAGGAGLATLHEGEELSAAPARLTHGALLATQGRRLRAAAAPDGMSLRGCERGERGERARPRLRGMDRHAVINTVQDQAMMIPRTQRVQSEALRVLPPSEFAPLLYEKLERVRRERESSERLERRLAEQGDGEDSSGHLPPQLIVAAIREKLQLDDDNDQDILDQHVSRVWSERTPGDSPPPRRARARRRPPSELSADSGLCEPPAPHHAPHPHRRSFSKKAGTEITDSGVSVVSEQTCGSSSVGVAGSGGVEPRVLQWVAEGSERLARARSDTERASSAEREERWEARHRSRPGSSRAATSASGSAATPTSSTTSAETVVVVSFLDELVPYRLRVPAAPLSLRIFKDYLPKKGNYRYFFKTECADLDNTVLQEEVSDDAALLPMFEGKVMARVKPVD